MLTPDTQYAMCRGCTTGQWFAERNPPVLPRIRLRGYSRFRGPEEVYVDDILIDASPERLLATVERAALGQALGAEIIRKSQTLGVFSVATANAELRDQGVNRQIPESGET